MSRYQMDDDMKQRQRVNVKVWEEWEYREYIEMGIVVICSLILSNFKWCKSFLGVV